MTILTPYYANESLEGWGRNEYTRDWSERFYR